MSIVMHKALSGGRFWALVPVLLLLSTFVGWGVMIKLALTDPGFGVEPDYYKKAIQFDARRQLESQSALLGWSAELQLAPAKARTTNVVLLLSRRDSAPVSGASVHVSAFHNARSSRVYELFLEEQRAGKYVARLNSNKAGLWEFRVRADRGQQHFFSTLRADLEAGND